MIWFYIATSALIVIMGFIFLLTPEKMLFLMSDAEKQRLMQGRLYPLSARIGGLLMIFVCAPLNLVTGFLFAGYSAMQ
jgi:hypothetical protein